MLKFRKTIVAAAAVASLAAAVPASASPYQWVPGSGGNFGNGLVSGLGMGVGLGITNRLFNPQPNTVIVQQPMCQTVYVQNAYGQLVPTSSC